MLWGKKTKSLWSRFLVYTTAVMLFVVPVIVHEVSAKFRTDDMTLYWAATDEPIAVQWDPVIQDIDGNTITEPVSYEIRAQWIRGDQIMQTYNLGQVIGATEFIINQGPRAGEIIVGIIAFYTPTGQTDPVYSTQWSNSSDPQISMVDGVNKGWMIVYYLTGTGPIIID